MLSEKKDIVWKADQTERRLEKELKQKTMALEDSRNKARSEVD